MKLKPERYFTGKELELVNASIEHDIEKVQYLCSLGVDINFIGREGMTPLIFCVLLEDLEALRIVLLSGANPTLIVPDVGSALSIACKLERIDPLQFMISYGADIFVLQDGEPLTWSAAEYGNKAALEILFENGISIDARDTAGDTLLIESILVNDIELASWLVDNGASVHAVNIFLMSAAACIQSRFQRAENGVNTPKYQQLMNLFEERGVVFPVPDSSELREKLGRESISIEEAERLNELGEYIED